MTKEITQPTVIFDLDGTLLNTIADLGKACNHALSSLGMPTHAVADYQKMVGNGFRTLIERAAPEGTPSETLDRLTALSREYYDCHCMESTEPYPGIPELLEELKTRGVRMAVASNKYQAAVERIIRHYFPDIDFIAVEGQREGRPIKPDPAILKSIMALNPLPETSTFMVGDSTVDIETARNAGIQSIAVTWGFSPQQELLEAAPDYLVSHPSQILPIITNSDTNKS